MNPMKDLPDHHDAELVLRLYELRREARMREARDAMSADYWPTSADEACAPILRTHQLNAAWRQTTTYWEMVFNMAQHGIVHPGYLVESSVEGLLLFARAEPWLKEIRKASSPRAFRHAEWAATSTDTGRELMDELRARVKKVMASRAS
jgi:hypothetical protein